MSIPGNVSLILAQVGQAERIAQELHAQPEVQRQAAQQAAPEILRRENAQVPVSEKGDASGKVRARGDREPRERGEQGERRQGGPAKEEEEPTPSPDATPPWAGNIVNIKV